MLYFIMSLYKTILHLHHMHDVALLGANTFRQFHQKQMIYKINEEIWEIVGVENDIFNSPEIL